MNDKVFKALADPTRRAILDLLIGGDMTAGDIAKHFSHAQATVSRHLAILKNAELVTTRRDGGFIWYRLHTTILEDWLKWIIDRWSNR